MTLLFDLLYLLVALLISPVAVYRMMRHKRYLSGWAQRFGRVARKYPQKRCIWIHAVSMGEVNATKTLVTQLEKQFPDCEIIISTTTDTGFARATALYGGNLAVFYFPFDFSWIRRRSFRRLKPSLCLFMELEVWPNFVAIAKKLNIPVVVVNGRISGKSFARYKQVQFFAKRIFRNLTLVFAQTEEYARRFEQIGCPKEKVLVTGSLKYDTAQIADTVDGAPQLAQQLDLQGKKLFVAGATGNNEEKIILDVYKQLMQTSDLSDLYLAIVPRKPERFDEVANLITQSGFDIIRYGRIKNTQSTCKLSPQTVILGDTMGDLRKFYSLAGIIFVGRSLVPMGGSDMMEAAALGKCTIFGPYTFNFEHTVDALLDGNGAILVNNEQELKDTVEKCLKNPSFTASIAANGRQIIRKNQGATQRTIDRIKKILTPE